MKNFRHIFIYILTIYILTSCVENKTLYETYFTDQRARINIVFQGDAYSQKASIKEIYKESVWSGSKNNLVDTLHYGEYRYSLYTKDGQLIFSKGFNNLFSEWRTIEQAKLTTNEFVESHWIPFPKQIVDFVLYYRDKSSGEFEELHRETIDPNSKNISIPKEFNYQIDTIQYSGNFSNKVDIVFVAEGYSHNESDKFKDDVNRATEYLFSMEPYSTRRSDFNVWALNSFNDQDDKTPLSSTFSTFGIDRYLTIPDHSSLGAILHNSHNDAVYILVNSSQYGGGGIYNYYAIGVSDHNLYGELFVHEFGHSFGGLGDEYYSSQVAYEEFYNLNIEPWEPNLTTRVNFSNKWESLINKETPIPTPNSYEYKNTIGLFEGGGYMSKGIYRPYLTCRMKENSAPDFCPVCIRAINKIIDSYVK